MKKVLLSVVCCCMCASVVYAQGVETGQTDVVYPLHHSPQGVDNYRSATYFHSGEAVYDLSNVQIAHVDGKIQDLKINPSETSFGVLYEKNKEQIVEIYNLFAVNDRLYQFKAVANPIALCYTPDAKYLLIATPNELLFHETRNQYALRDKMEMPFAATKLTVSKNGYYLAATDGERLTVWNLAQKKIRKEFDLGTHVNDIAFSDDNNSFAVLTDDGSLSVFDTRSYACKQTVQALGYAKRCAFHPESKYISVVSGDGRIATVNLYDEKDRTYVDNQDGGISELFYITDEQKRILLMYNTKGTISLKLMSELAPHYAKLLADELNDRMSEWMKMLPNESLEEYNLRVNDETRLTQMQLFEEEIATRMAANPLEMSQISLGNYNSENNMLAVGFDNMPPIYLPVPLEDVNDFKNPNDLEFRDMKYGLTVNDNFELIYADVFNKNNQKSYIFDNRERRKLDNLQSDENFVPLDLIQQSNMETMKLQEIQQSVVNLAKQEKSISDHTNIDVHAEVVPGQDADGNSIMNYKINFEYEVEPKFSVYEDFAPGKYQAENSGAAMAMLSIVKKAFEQDFAQYIKEGKKLQIHIKGMADALPINNTIAYNGCYGDFVGEPVYKNNDLSNITVTQADGITQNEQLAFLRATGVQQYIQKNIPELSQMDTDFRTYIEITKRKGGAYRRITVEFIFVDVF